MEILNIDGTALPAPSAYKVQLSDLDSSGTGRTEDGVLVRERVRGGVAKISAGWAALSTADCARVLNATAPDSMTVQYFFGGRPAALPQQAVYGMAAGGACPAPTWMWKRGE